MIARGRDYYKEAKTWIILSKDPKYMLRGESTAFLQVDMEEPCLLSGGSSRITPTCGGFKV